MSAPATNMNKLQNGWFSEINDQWPGKEEGQRERGREEQRRDSVGCAERSRGRDKRAAID